MTNDKLDSNTHRFLIEPKLVHFLNENKEPRESDHSFKRACLGSRHNYFLVTGLLHPRHAPYRRGEVPLLDFNFFYKRFILKISNYTLKFYMILAKPYNHR